MRLSFTSPPNPRPSKAGANRAAMPLLHSQHNLKVSFDNPPCLWHNVPHQWWFFRFFFVWLSSSIYNFSQAAFDKLLYSLSVRRNFFSSFSWLFQILRSYFSQVHTQKLLSTFYTSLPLSVKKMAGIVSCKATYFPPAKNPSVHLRHPTASQH